ncbi:hypothetical protein [Paenibacillus macerans]|uniref:hypothetical protein n=1 Tax=Paenibacillus macerans TaxID=44252 RepID=UPI002041E519|nr:hypothetical protein [Paenibacillus macerans]MCM3699427.1 hypothetical protein [Paenibacillus macerans]
MDNELTELLRSVIKEELTPVNERMDRFGQRFDRIDQRFDQVDQRFDQVDQRFEQVDQRLDRLENEQQAMKQDQELIKRAVLETNDRLKNVESILENQHKIIELLSARSIQQEAELKRIK